MDLPTFTLVHVLISVLGILSGLVVAGGLASGKLLGGWNGYFLATTVLTSVTGFGFPFVKVGPPHIVGVLSLIVLAVALVALYGKKLAGGWRTAYVITAVVALYLNTFVLVVQLLVKTPPIAKIAPEGSPAFGLTHLVVLGLFGWLGWAALR
ncbi:MAG: hypothetical protein ABUU24_09545, partial [Variovorax sp.]